MFSALNSLTLSPALAALLLKPHGSRRDPVTFVLDLTLGWFFKLFNASFRIGTQVYGWLVGVTLRVCVLALLVYVGLLGVTGWLFSFYPVGFIPQQDQGWLLVNVQLPDSASVQRTRDIILRIDQIARATPGVASTVSVAGQSVLLTTNSSNFGSMFVVLDEFGKRKKPELHANAIMTRLRQACHEQIREARIDVFGAPPVPGIGIAGGFKLMVEDRGALGMDNLAEAGRSG